MQNLPMSLFDPSLNCITVSLESKVSLHMDHLQHIFCWHPTIIYIFACLHEVKVHLYQQLVCCCSIITHIATYTLYNNILYSGEILREVRGNT